MILSILIIIVIALTAFWWSNQGTFSAFLHMLCCLVAGAVAFAAWEPVAYLLLGAGGLPPPRSPEALQLQGFRAEALKPWSFRASGLQP